MIITCPGCATRYEVPETAFSIEGRQVRCKACMFKWHAVPEESAPDSLDADTDPREFDFAQHLADADRLTSNLSVLGGIRRPVRDIETEATDTFPPPRRDAARYPLATAFVAAAASLALIVGTGYLFRNDVVRAVPTMAALYDLVGLPVNVRGMEFANVVVGREYENGLPVLAVRGEIVNVTAAMVAVPRVRFGLRDGSSNEIYHWTTAVETDVLAPDERAAFVTKLAAPPQDAHDVVVRFNDLVGQRASIR